MLGVRPATLRSWLSGTSRKPKKARLDAVLARIAAVECALTFDALASALHCAAPSEKLEKLYTVVSRERNKHNMGIVLTAYAQNIAYKLLAEINLRPIVRLEHIPDAYPCSITVHCAFPTHTDFTAAITLEGSTLAHDAPICTVTIRHSGSEVYEKITKASGGWVDDISANIQNILKNDDRKLSRFA